jgi:hypothetical protein
VYRWNKTNKSAYSFLTSKPYTNVQKNHIVYSKKDANMKYKNTNTMPWYDFQLAVKIQETVTHHLKDWKKFFGKYSKTSIAPVQ